MKHTVTRTSEQVLMVDFADVTNGFEQWVFCRSDAHHDNAHCNQVLERKHLELAKKRNALIIDYGDLFCAMQGKWDKRASEDAMRPEYRGGKYLDKLVNVAAEFYGPYAKNILQLSPGNHETAISKRHETNLTERLAERLSEKHGCTIHTGNYRNYIRLRFGWVGGPRRQAVVTIAAYHGYGGGAPVSRGVIDTARTGLYLRDADIVLMGHNHNAYEVPIMRECITTQGRVYKKEQVHIRTAGYKDETSNGNGFAAEVGMAPKPNGGTFIRFYVADGDVTRNEISYDIIRAK